MAENFRRFRVIEKVKESSNISSFYFEPKEAMPIWQALPGQYLTLRIPVKETFILKTYSISNSIDNAQRYRISVKRESFPPDSPDLPEGIGSCWLHDHVEAGTEIEIAAPRGAFVLDETSTRPVVLLSGGVGQTPLLCMAHRLSISNRKVWYIHACENGLVHALGSEIAELASQVQSSIYVHTVYRLPTDQDRIENSFDSEGMIDKRLLQSLLPLDDYDVYMCGPVSFMTAMYQLLVNLGITRKRIAYEFFGKAQSLDTLIQDNAKIQSKAATHAPPSLAKLKYLTNPKLHGLSLKKLNQSNNAAIESDILPKSCQVVFNRSAVTTIWDGQTKSLLELAEQSGLYPDFSCRSGICNTCRCVIRKGQVSYFQEPLELPPDGEVLICCSRPKGRVVLEL